MTFELFVRPAIRRLAGHRDDDLFRPDGPGGPRRRRDQEPADVAGSSACGPSGTTVGSPVRDDAGRVRASLAGGRGGQGSHVLSALAAADALAVIPEADDTLPAGAEVEIWWLDRA